MVSVCSHSRWFAWLLGLILLLCSTAQPAAAQKKAALANGTPAITTTDGVKLYTKVAGKGVPCVFVHGAPGRAATASKRWQAKPWSKASR
ncbi:hypothetical protein [Hymenobacter cellulosilyticus]|uniref:Alpha/beta hydrolase n=1 Tax=Hymenobacter cellulosilyticus TaxID=2932248 RepID=A0A8T9Q816_9BACT|nr:hypothetical protein [Hymenobacter cellulosilyticus]UOQ73285.1 hypothetical protein MUN79_04770 [Hymenobacter cellulosilyticus]